eukprot:CAMPEP_0174328522 /NCGR_PEP_ID=MMETSP0810-20121108/15198_1 /TAXON_ID=73025 ORGANISM="Eutreptiella gymnastica-like, Strain CCMP1594" /NCGR_SAMPLE_ID=MMETSP0810 /ASSEMBLY_ACC=CAM_ASM_000659 /LENGTH=154 /DNA_ID=CAMNT_0015442647 /DNA_START=16 /DNA_END=476 /DNA_ORIENTATION=+
MAAVDPRLALLAPAASSDARPTRSHGAVAAALLVPAVVAAVLLLPSAAPQTALLTPVAPGQAPTAVPLRSALPRRPQAPPRQALGRAAAGRQAEAARAHAPGAPTPTGPQASRAGVWGTPRVPAAAWTMMALGGVLGGIAAALRLVAPSPAAAP